MSRFASRARRHSEITTSRKKVYTTKRPSKYSNIGTLKNPPFSKKIYVIIRDLTPELSLHVAWQKRFLPDLLEIIETAKFDVLIATHSPYIVGERSDLMIGLGEDPA